MPRDASTAIVRKFLLALLFLAGVVTAGSAGYWIVSGREASLLDCVYMTIITITTIGYGEIIDLGGNPAGRLLTIFVAFSGIGIMTYILLHLTAFVVEGQLNEAFRRKKMEKAVSKFRDHFIVCGVTGSGLHIIDELRSTERPTVAVDTSAERLQRAAGLNPGLVYIEGDATDSETLLKAGIDRSRGLFAVTGDDNQNLVVALTAKQINQAIKVVARCEETRNAEKMKKAGADSIVSPTLIGGLRMASEMVRPAVVSFLDVMLRQGDGSLRIEEQTVPASHEGRTLSSLELSRYCHLLLMAVLSGGSWIHNPPREYVMKAGDTLIFMSSPGERRELEELFSVVS